MQRPHCLQRGSGCWRVCKGKGKCLLLHAVSAVLKRTYILYITLAYYLTLTVAHSVHGISNTLKL